MAAATLKARPLALGRLPACRGPCCFMPRGLAGLTDTLPSGPAPSRITPTWPRLGGGLRFRFWLGGFSILLSAIQLPLDVLFGASKPLPAATSSILRTSHDAGLQQ